MGEGERVTEWETGLPAAEDLPPLGQALIPPGLASAFSISPGPCNTFLDVARASETTFSGIRSGTVGSSIQMPDEDLIGDEEVDDEGDRNCKLRRTEEGGKRPRVVWTPQLHKRFVEVVAHLGIKKAVPKTIMQLMNVEGLTRENVASHLQKYRLYLKRMQGGSGGGLPTDGNEYPNGSGDSNNSNSDGGSSNGYQVAFHPHPGMMPVPMPMYGHLGSNGGGGSSNHHHHHHFHHHQHQFNGYENGGNQSGYDGFQGGSCMVPPSDALRDEWRVNMRCVMLS